jgi:hypothetical protein
MLAVKVASADRLFRKSTAKKNYKKIQYANAG